MYTIGLRTNAECLGAALALSVFSGVAFIGGLVHASSRRLYDPGLRWHSNVVSLVTHHASALVGIGSLAWAGHIVHVALPASRGVPLRWQQLLTNAPSPFGLVPLFTGDWKMYAMQPDRAGHLFGTLDAATGSAILTFMGTRAARSGSLWLSDVAHHHVALGIVALFLGHLVLGANVAGIADSGSLH